MPISYRRFTWPAVLAYGFRPFFLLSAIWALLAVPAWLFVLLNATGAATTLPPHAWHAHELLYGFIGAAVAGFLLTAIPSWTGSRGYAGAPLLVLVLIWGAGRVAMGVPLGLPSWASAAIDLAFLPALALTVLPALLRSGGGRNLVFLALLAALFGVNLDFHWHGASDSSRLWLAIDLVLFMVVLVGGRILPAFTASGLKKRGIDIAIRRHVAIDSAALLATLAVVVGDALFAGTGLVAGVSLLAAALLVVRQARWHPLRTLRDPITWILHLAYAWLPLGLALKAAWLLGAPIPANSWIHALGAGAFALMILGVMSRAALGHTGRELVVSRATVIAYFLVAFAALLRVFGPILFEPGWRGWMLASGVCWTLGFALFLLVYVPILWRPRIDGKPG